MSGELLQRIGNSCFKTEALGKKKKKKSSSVYSSILLFFMMGLSWREGGCSGDAHLVSSPSLCEQYNEIRKFSDVFILE